MAISYIEIFFTSLVLLLSAVCTSPFSDPNTFAPLIAPLATPSRASAFGSAVPFRAPLSLDQLQSLLFQRSPTADVSEAQSKHCQNG